MTNSVLAHSTESNFWKNRHETLNDRNQKGIQLASLGSFSSSSALPPLQPSRLFPPPSFNLRKLKPRSKSKETKFLPAQFGSIRKISRPAKFPADKTVILIQDIHLNSEAQGNINKTIEHLLQTESIDLLALEGAFGPLDLSALKEFPHPPSVKNAAKFLLDKNEISGGLYSVLNK